MIKLDLLTYRQALYNEALMDYILNDKGFTDTTKTDMNRYVVNMQLNYMEDGKPIICFETVPLKKSAIDEIKDQPFF